MAGTVNAPVAVLKVLPAVGAVICVIVVFAVVAGLAPTVSLVSTLTEPAVPNGVVTLSAKASITAIGTATALFPALPSLLALVVPATPTLVCVTSVPLLAVPGIVTVIGQVMVPLASTVVALLPALKVQVPVATVAPAGVPAAAVHVTLAAVAVPTFVHTKLPVRTAPGPAVEGRPVMATFMSDGISLTTAVLVQRAGSGATQAGSPEVTVAVLDTLALLVLVTFSVTTFDAAAAGARPAALTQLMVAAPVAVVGVQVQPAAFVSPVSVTPAGSAS